MHKYSGRKKLVGGGGLDRRRGKLIRSDHRGEKEDPRTCRKLVLEDVASLFWRNCRKRSKEKTGRKAYFLTYTLKFEAPLKEGEKDRDIGDRGGRSGDWKTGGLVLEEGGGDLKSRGRFTSNTEPFLKKDR